MPPSRITESPAYRCGAMRHSLTVWHLLTQVKNYTDAKSSVILKLSVSGQPLGQRTPALLPASWSTRRMNLHGERAGCCRPRSLRPTIWRADDHAVVNLPTFRVVRVALFAGSSPFANDLLTVLSSNPYLQTEAVLPGTEMNFPPDVAIYQGSSLPAQIQYNSIVFLSGPASASAHPLRVIGWNSQHPATRWVLPHDVSVRNPAVLDVQPNDTVLAYAEGDPPVPLILAREQNGHRLLIIGFDPHDSNFPLQSAFPLPWWLGEWNG